MTSRWASASLACAVACVLFQTSLRSSPSDGNAGGPAPPPPYPARDGAPPGPAATQNDALVAPIALYPDPLIALMLTAATVPNDIASASSYLIQYGDRTRIDRQPWDPSVRALAHYPTVVAWMAANMEWTQALGAAFIASPSDVMDAVQRLRARALASGALASTAQQQVYSDGGTIEIYPAQPDSVYIPLYDDGVVYSDGTYNGYGGPFINFGEPYPAGAWLSFYFDWGRHRVWAGDQNVWNGHHGWQPPRVGGDRSPPGAKPWQPPASGSRHVHLSGPVTGNGVPLPHPMPGAPNPPPDRFRGQAAQPAQQAGRLPQAAASGAAGPHLGPLPGPALLPPAPAREYSGFPARSSQPAAARSEPAHASAPAPAPPSSGNQQPQK